MMTLTMAGMKGPRKPSFHFKIEKKWLPRWMLRLRLTSNSLDPLPSKIDSRTMCLTLSSLPRMLESRFGYLLVTKLKQPSILECLQVFSTQRTAIGIRLSKLISLS